MTKVLVVDDSSSIRKYVRHFLVEAGYEVIEAGDGHQGFEAVEQNPDIQLIFCDINMPFFNGIQMLEKLSKHNLVGNISVIMLTTEANAATVEKARAAGAKGWMVKPVDSERLLLIAKKLTSGEA